MNEKVLVWLDEQEEWLDDFEPLEVPAHLQGYAYSADEFDGLMGAFE